MTTIPVRILQGAVTTAFVAGVAGFGGDALAGTLEGAEAGSWQDTAKKAAAAASNAVADAGQSITSQFTNADLSPMQNRLAAIGVAAVAGGAVSGALSAAITGPDEDGPNHGLSNGLPGPQDGGRSYS